MCYNSENRLKTLFLDSMWQSDNFWETFEDIKRGKDVRISRKSTKGRQYNGQMKNDNRENK